MATATLTAQLTQGVTYTTISVTAMPVAVGTGEVVYASQGLTNAEAFTVSSPVAVNAVTINVTSQQAAQTHLVGENVAPRYTLTAVGRSMALIQTPRFTKL